jgi:hypothetical protein
MCSDYSLRAWERGAPEMFAGLNFLIIFPGNEHQISSIYENPNTEEYTQIT